LSLSTLDVGRVGEHAEVWEKVAFKLRARFMPPSGRPRPDEATYDSLVAYLEAGVPKEVPGFATAPDGASHRGKLIARAAVPWSRRHPHRRRPRVDGEFVRYKVNDGIA
jgi:hypothetical protein